LFPAHPRNSVNSLKMAQAKPLAATSLFQQTPSKQAAVSPELQQMMTKFRTLEDRKAKTITLDDPTHHHRTQRQQIDKLKKDNMRLQDDLALETRQAKQANFYSASLQIAKLQDQGDSYARKIDAEQALIRNLDQEIRELEGQILQQRKDMKGVNAAHEASKAMQKRIRNLENQLDKALVKFNEAQTHNKQLHLDIENLRLDRDREADIQQKLKSTLVLKTQQANRLFEEIHAAHKKRDQAQADVIAIGSQASNSLGESDEQWVRLGAALERDRQMDSWQIGSGTAAQSGADETVGKEAKSTRSLSFAPSETQKMAAVDGWDEEIALEEEESLKRRLQKLQVTNAKDKRAIDDNSASLAALEESFEKIFRATGNVEMDVDLLVKAFVNAEETNFALFNRVNEMTNEIEKLQERIAEVQDEISKYKGSAGAEGAADPSSQDAILNVSFSSMASASFSQSSETGTGAALGPRGKQNKQKNILRDLQAKIEKAELKSVQYESKYKSALQTVAAVKDSVSEIFQKLKIGDDLNAKILGDGQVTETNMMAFLAIIEARSTDLLQRKKLLEETKGDLGAEASDAAAKDGEAAAGDDAVRGDDMLDDRVGDVGDPVRDD
jgi:coiled-coil domain-containing protein 63/114